MYFLLEPKEGPPSFFKSTESIRVKGTKVNQPFSFQYYVEENRLEYNPKNYIPADAWQISQNILGYFNDFQGLI